MSSVNVTINGKQYRMACEPGQEEQLTSLADDFEARINTVRERFGEVGDARITVMAALMVGDELRDARKTVARLEAEVMSLQEARAGAADRANRTEAAVVSALDAASDRIERMALSLSRPAGAGMAIG